MIDLFSEASAIARNMLGYYLSAGSEVRDQLPGAGLARSAWDMVEREFERDGLQDVIKSVSSHPENIAYDLPRPLMKIMRKNDSFAGELRQLYDIFLAKFSSGEINVGQQIDEISGSGKVIGVSYVETSLGQISGNIIPNKGEPPSENKTN